MTLILRHRYITFENGVTIVVHIYLSEISKNVSRIQSLCYDGKLYNYTDHCLMRVNERSDINGCRDMAQLQNCGKINELYYKS